MKKIVVIVIAIIVLGSLFGSIPSCPKAERKHIEIKASTQNATVGSTVTVSAYGYGGVDEGKAQFSITDNQCGAVLEGRNLRAEKEGVCVVTVTCDGYSSSITINFKYPEIKLVLSEASLSLGTRCKLGYTLDPTGSLLATAGYMTYTVDEGRAKIEKEDGQWYLTPLTSGEINVTATYQNGNVSFSKVCPITVEGVSFTIGLVEETARRYFDIPLKVTAAQFPEFDETKVTFVTDTEGVTIEGNVIKASDKETINVWATYEYLGITVKSEALTITLDNSLNPINTAADLERMRDSGDTFVLLSDIDLSAIENWEPINGFSGTLNGNGHKITGMNLVVGHEQECKGLFGLNKGTITDLSVSGTITSTGESKYIGILCGNNHGTIRNVTASGTINTPYCDYVGGVVGYCNNSYVSDLTSNVRIDAREQVGGVIGHLHFSRTSSLVVENLTNNGEIHGNYRTGGVIGSCGVHEGENNDGITVRKLYNNGTVIVTGNDAGGIIGFLSGNYYKKSKYDHYYSTVTLNECKNTGTVTGRDYVGGIVGSISSYVGELTQAENTADVSGNLCVGGYVGISNSATMRGLKNANTITGKAYVGGIVGNGQVVLACENTGVILAQSYHLDESGRKLSFVGGVAGHATNIADCTNHASIDVSAGGEYVGGIAGSVIAIRSSGSPNSGNKNYGEVKGTKTVGGIAGELRLQDGENNDTVMLEGNVNEASVTGTDAYVGGLVGYIRGDYYAPSKYDSYYSHIRVTSCKNTGDISGVDYVGGLFGNAQEYVSEISMCENTGDIEGRDFVGGYAGRANGTTMRLLTNNQTITGRAVVGGVVGEAGALNECVNNGTLVITGYHLDGDTPVSYVGGVGGAVYGAVVNCTNNASVEAENGGAYVGGVVGCLRIGRSASNTVSGNKNYGDVSGVVYVGGIAGYMTISNGEANITIVVKENTNEGEISATATYVGGIFGHMSGNYYKPNKYDDYTAYVKIQDCKNTADIIGADYAGGIVGYCGGYVDGNAAFWDTNIFEGSIECEGEHQGDKFAYFG